MPGLVRIPRRRHLHGRPNGSPTYIGTPSVGVWGPGYGNNIPGMGGLGVTTGPLLPGQTITTPIGGQ